MSAALAVVLVATAMAQDQDSAQRGRKYKAPPPVSHVTVNVVRATTGKPVTDASVIFHPLRHGRDSGNMELKTDSDGKAIIDVIETGSTIRLQVIAPNFQTFGQDYKIDKPSMALTIKLDRPSRQYSIYGQDGQSGNSGSGNSGSGSSGSGGAGSGNSGQSGAAKPDQQKPNL